VRYTSNGGSPGTRMVGAVDSMPEWHERLRPVIILNLDGFGMVARIEDKLGSVVYVDPPYLKKSFKYTHDFAAGDHARLASLLSQFTQTRIVVSYYDHPDLVALYRGWTIIPLDVTKGLGNAGRRDEGGAVAAPEVLLVNGPAIDDAGGMFGG
jgi:DNA adenine methylase